MDDEDGLLRLVRIRCRHVAAGRHGTIVARDVDASGRVHFVLVQPHTGGGPLKYAVDPATGQVFGPPLQEY